MQSNAWQDKQLHTALGSWAELKHDTILYAKQVYAEMGGGGPAPPRPVPARGYVEPVPDFYARLRGLVQMTREGLGGRQMLSNRDTANLERLTDLLQTLQTMAEKELQGEPLTQAEYDRIRYYGGELEHLVMASADTPDDDPNAMPVLEEDPQAAIISDVATEPDPDGDGVPNPVVLEVGVGRINELYAVVPLIDLDGTIFLQVAKGGIFSYYEFLHPAEDRLTDEKWRQMLAEGRPPEPPAWINGFFTTAGEYSDFQEAIYTFQNALVETVFYLNPAQEWHVMERAKALTEIAGPEVVSQIETQIAELESHKQYLSRRWINTTYRSFDRQADDLAVVTVRETWQDWLHQYETEQFMTGEDPAIAMRGPYKLEATYTLKRNQAGNWLITRAVYANEPPEWQPITESGYFIPYDDTTPMGGVEK